MQERFSLCWAAVHSLNISSTFAGVDNLSKHPAAKCLTRKTEPKRHNCTLKHEMGFRILLLLKGSNAFLLLAQLPSDESQTKTCSNLSVRLIPQSQDSSLGVNESCTNIFTCQEAPLHFSSVHFSRGGASSRYFRGDYCKFSLCWLVMFTIQEDIPLHCFLKQSWVV